MEFFKVTTSDRKSLGLRKNPTILTFPLREWVESPTVKKGNSDEGGIWLATTYSNAKRLKKYMFDRYGESCRIFRASVGQILFRNVYRVKTDRVRCEVEILQND